MTTVTLKPVPPTRAVAPFARGPVLAIAAVVAVAQAGDEAAVARIDSLVALASS